MKKIYYKIFISTLIMLLLSFLYYLVYFNLWPPGERITWEHNGLDLILYSLVPMIGGFSYGYIFKKDIIYSWIGFLLSSFILGGINIINSSYWKNPFLFWLGLFSFGPAIFFSPFTLIFGYLGRDCANRSFYKSSFYASEKETSEKDEIIVWPRTLKIAVIVPFLIIWLVAVFYLYFLFFQNRTMSE